MAGTYYSATPIGAGLGNIAQAISGIPARREQAALLAQRRDLAASQILTDAERRGKYKEETAGLLQKRQGRESMAGVFENSGTTGEGGPDADPQPSAEPPSISTAFMGTRVPGDPISVATPTPVAPQSQVTPVTLGAPNVAGAVAPQGTPVAPATPVTPAAPSAPNVAGAVAPQGNRIGWTPEMNRRFYAASARAGEDNAAKYVRGFTGGSMAATEPDQDKALSYSQAGAGQNFATTVFGVGQAQKEKVRENDLQSSDRQRGQDKLSSDRQRGQNMLSSDRQRGQNLTNDRAGSKGGAKGKARELTPAQQGKLADEVNVEGANKLGRKLNAEESRNVVGAINDAFATGMSYADAKASVLDKMVTGDKGESPPWYKPWGDSKPDTRKLNVTRTAPASTAPASSAPASPTPGPNARGPGYAGGSSAAAAGGTEDILNQELRKAQTQLDEAKSKGDADAAHRAESDIKAVQSELGRLPGGKRAASPAAPVPAATASASQGPTQDQLRKVAALRKTAKANGWSEQQIDDALKKKGY